MTMTFSPRTLSERGDLVAALKMDGYAVMSAVDVGVVAGCDVATLQAWRGFWSHLPVDSYLRDGGQYRRRRHSCFTVHAQAVAQVAHRPHWQPLEYNALHGGMQRHFEPMEPSIVTAPAWHTLLGWLGQVCSELKGEQTWYAEAHQFRIDTTGGIGRPTPEGAHRDGVDLVAVFMVDRHAVKGGETRVFDAFDSSGQRFTLTEPWSVLLLDDVRVVHESTPIQPLAPDAHRDTLVVTLRAKGFQDISGV